MHFRMGCTRIVVLTETVAIKIALPMFSSLMTIWIVIDAFIKGELSAKLKKYEGNILRIAVRVLTNVSIDANRREIRISREHPEYPIASVLRSYLWGMVIVMRRAESVKSLPDSWENQLSFQKLFPQSDLLNPKNVGLINGRLCIIDYGNPTADEILAILFRKHSGKNWLHSNKVIVNDRLQPVGNCCIGE